MTTDTTHQAAAALHELLDARRQADEDHRRRLAELDGHERALLGSLSTDDLDAPNLRAAVAGLSGNEAARALLSAWAQKITAGKFDLTYSRVAVPVRFDDEHGQARYDSATPMIPTLHSNTGLIRRGRDGVRRPDPAAVEQLAAAVTALCEGAGVVALNLDALDLGAQVILRGEDGTWEHRGPAPHGVLQHRGTLEEVIRWFHRAITAVKDEETTKLWSAPGETRAERLSEEPTPFWRERGR